MYKENTETNEKLMKIAERKFSDPESMAEAIDKELNNVKYICFGKAKVFSKSKDQRQLDKLQSEKINIVNRMPDEPTVEEMKRINDEMANILREMQNKQLEYDINDLQKIKQYRGKSASIFKLREKLLRSKNQHKNKF